MRFLPPLRHIRVEAASPAHRMPVCHHVISLWSIGPRSSLIPHMHQPPMNQARAQVEATWLKRLGRPEDMAAAVAYLCSDDAAYVTGETLVVSGGLPSRL